MVVFKKVACLTAICVTFTGYVFSQNTVSLPVSLNKLDAFNKPGKNWVAVSSASADFSKSQNIKYKSGEGILLNTSKKDGTDLVSSQEFGDAEIDLDFMMAGSSVSAIYLEGRYGIKLADSWKKQNPTLADLGAVEQVTDNHGKAQDGSAPFMNVARAPGLWQHIKIKFRAPVFVNGVKTKNARFEEVSVNGTTIQLENDLTGPTVFTIFKDEKASGPLMIKGNGGIVAFRNITYTPLQPLPSPDFGNPLSKRRNAPVNPIFLKPQNQPYLLRSFLMFNHIKRTHVISMGDPNGLNFSYDLKQGALFQVWRGQFLDVTEMWENRGEPQLAKPLGSVLGLSVAPVLATLNNIENRWPDSVAFDDLQNKGYQLDKNRMPTFLYSYAGADITDKISAQANGESLLRNVSVTNAPGNFYFRIAEAAAIEKLENGLYAIGHQLYYIRFGEETKPVIRSTKNGQELIVALKKGSNTLSYSLIW
ncbi:MAG: hypothetical protein JWR67_470 [Mucilaginibacter sp.]|nr:hypothetical protein [Mucilaginibacter sp.]